MKLLASLLLACLCVCALAQQDPTPDFGFDLAINADALSPTFVWTQISENSCDIAAGCALGSGMRRLLKFTTEVINMGNDIPLGNPDNNPTFFTLNECRNQYERADLNAHVLLDQRGNTLAQSTKRGFCLSDMNNINSTFTAQYDCSNQGLTAGFSDVYAADLDCQYIDVTDVRPGVYWLRVEVNANGAFPEQNHTNNVAWQLITLMRSTAPAQASPVAPTTRTSRVASGWRSSLF